MRCKTFRATGRIDYFRHQSGLKTAFMDPIAEAHLPRSSIRSKPTNDPAYRADDAVDGDAGCKSDDKAYPQLGAGHKLFGSYRLGTRFPKANSSGWPI
jgi:hypothetical protein